MPIGPFICDFAARTARLIVELDGGQHADAAAQDERRRRFLVDHGYRVLRFWNNDVLENIDGVLGVIEDALKNSPSPPPSREREGK